MRPCNSPGCPELVNRGRCAAHSLQRAREVGSSGKRGYGWDWQQTRELQRARQPLCEDCIRAGRVTPMQEAHHIRKFRTGEGPRLDLDNLMSLCRACHAKRTARGE